MIKNKKLLSVFGLMLMLVIMFTGCGRGQEASFDHTAYTLPAPVLPDYFPFTSQQLKDAWEKNGDVTGWLVVRDCDIDNQVFIGVDNDEYLRLDEEGNYYIWGCYFMDYRNDNDGYTLPDKVSVIYGHSLNDTPDSKKFSRLKQYRDPEFALRHQIIEFSLLYSKLQAQIFAVSNIPITIDYIDPNPNEEKYRYTLNYLTDHSFVDFGVEVTTDDHILLLSTCTSNSNVRFVVAAKILTEE